MVANRTKLTVLFNNEAYHSPSLSLAVLDNILFMSLSGADASITISNKPQPRSQAKESLGYVCFMFLPLHLKCILPTLFNYVSVILAIDGNSVLDESFGSFCRSAEGKVVALKIQLGMALLVSGFCLLTVTERTTKAKHIQFLSGVSVLVYWLSALLFDLIIFFVSCCLLLVSVRQCL